MTEKPTVTSEGRLFKIITHALQTGAPVLPLRLPDGSVLRLSRREMWRVRLHLWRKKGTRAQARGARQIAAGKIPANQILRVIK